MCHQLALCHRSTSALWHCGAASSLSVVVLCRRCPCPGCVGCVLVLGTCHRWCMVVVLIAICWWWWWALVTVCVVGGPSSLFVLPHCPCIIAIRRGVHGGHCRRGTWIVSSGGLRWLFTHRGGRKQPDDAHCVVSTLPVLVWLVMWHCKVVVVLWCAVVIVGGGGHG